MTADAETQRHLALHEERGDFVTDVDGFVYFWPEGNHGCYAAHHLRAIADELDRRNAPWEAEINRYFAEHPPDENVDIDP